MKMLSQERFSTLLMLLMLCLSGCTPYVRQPKILLAPNQVLIYEGDSLYSVAERYGVTPKSLMDANSLSSTRVLVGQVLVVPPKETRDDSPQVVVAQTEADITEIPAVDEEAVKVVASAVNASPATPSKPIIAPPKPETPLSEYIWPIDVQKVARPFGQGRGPLSAGVILAAPAQSTVVPVFAIREGTVGHVGDELKDYGMMVILKHDDGSISVYGFLGPKPLVKAGDKVAQNQVLGNLKKAKAGQAPQLYLELRQKKAGNPKPKPVNPVPLLGQRP
jgi:murein DD-endopeptidase MepM/ murein hydrolase activator NlpD